MIVPANELDPDRWDQFIDASPQGSPYALYNTLTEILPDWKAIIIENAGRWEAVFPLTAKKKYGISYCFQLPWTQFGGVMLAPMDLKPTSYFDKVKKITNAIIDIVDHSCTAIDINLSPNFDYPLPFLWRGYSLTPRYSYQIEFNELFEVEASYSAKTRNTIRKANDLGYEVSRMKDIGDMVRMFREMVGKQVDHLGHVDYLKMENVARHLQQNDQALALEASLNGVVVGGVMIYIYKGIAIYPIGTVATEHRTSGVMSLLIHEAILEAQRRKCTVFDFEGSIHEDIERFFRGFGGRPVPYINIRKSPFWLDLIRRKR